ncbi:TRAP transporter substrate-binding protein [Devosia sp. J2-20]|jgi:TRAP-type mannitol/chloroaromatic compound transport system substrate-binding protein|uniref:TRAP transporter substrate-binding protein n=1 Tax=Devosia litorisediminis TaxID=2829817 RepID=A0A942ICG2_9HYPH|nr:MULTISPECIES: TRAP transporter substrate-binding protein [Devosia]MBS3847120.1 TRAP transporter substrate-binding protein [Devosia litorisediminis]MCZ4346493.1 TRAP transporter substrate-binding protein [Devosia neptuniae]WDQ99751.1 TRAP transporter substrate-binding protein [Devosia sp. J2-20]|tara:strand:- start:3433 stop:4530 length:1098 start_codon:yes stop_codon:yes gene_type:complete
MKRREFFKSASVATIGAAAATTLATPAIAQDVYNWRMVTTWPKNFPGLGVGAQKLADRITNASGGRLNVQVFASGEMVPGLQALDAVIDGSAEMSHGAAYYWQNKSQALSFFTGVPYGMTSRELASWVRYLGGQEQWDKIYDQFGLKGYLSGDTGTQAGGWFKNELTGVADVQGLRFRTPGLGGQVWAKLGASVTNMAAGEIFAALQSGTLDAAEFVGPYNDLALGFYQVAKNYYFPSFVEPGLATELVVNKSKLAELPPDLQELVSVCAQASYDDVASDMYANDPRALRSLVDDHGVQVRAFPDEILEAGAKASMEVIAEIREGGDALTKETAESFISAFNLLRERTEGTDAPFLTARQKYIKY